MALEDADHTSVVSIRQADGSYTAAEATPYVLSAAAGGAYSFVTQDGAARTDEAGHPTGIANSAGAGLRVAYTSAGRIASVTTTEGRTVTFSTDNAGRLIQGALADGSRVTGLRRWDAGRAESTRAHWRHRTSGQPSSPCGDTVSGDLRPLRDADGAVLDEDGGEG